MGIFNPCDILLPKNADMHKWSVVACDQYTSEKEYWEKIDKKVGSSPSTLRLIFPEAYLDTVDFDSKVKEINETMQSYLDSGIFSEYKNAFVFVKRTFPSGKVRHGIVGAVDLEEYNYKKDSTSRIRATEATVEDRLPPRVAIRRHAPVELPHILMLIDDKKDSVMGKMKVKPPKKMLYDFDLLGNGGHITGYLADDNATLMSAIDSLGTDPLIAVGDGNHSLAAAKKCWEELKPTLTEEEKENHPMRFALCEVVNLYEDSLVFEPIYRVFFGCDVAALLSELKNTAGKYSYNIKCVTGEGEKTVSLKSDCHIESGAVTEFLEKYQKEHGGKIDYIHGEDTAESMGRCDGNIAFMVTCLEKGDLFKTVNTFGPLPKKTFSMGNANEKRFYTEARKLVR